MGDFGHDESGKLYVDFLMTKDKIGYGVVEKVLVNIVGKERTGIGDMQELGLLMSTMMVLSVGTINEHSQGV